MLQDELADLGRAIRLLRHTRRLSQEALGDRCYMHRNMVGAIERGESNPTFRVLLRLATGLSVSLADVMFAYDSVKQARAGAGVRGARTSWDQLVRSANS